MRILHMWLTLPKIQRLIKNFNYILENIYTYMYIYKHQDNNVKSTITSAIDFYVAK